MTGSSAALALAAWLRAQSDDALFALISVREVRDPGIRDVFDLAEALLEPTSIQSVLAHRDRVALGVLAAAIPTPGTSHGPTPDAVADRLGRPAAELAPVVELLVGLALLAEDDARLTTRAPVAEVLRAWPEQDLPSPEQLLDQPAPAALEPLDGEARERADRVAGEQAFGTVTAIGELVTALEREPARRLQRGGITLPHWRRLLTATGADDEQLGALLGIAQDVGLAAPAHGAWHATADAAWHDAGRAERWRLLAAGWLERVPGELRAQLRARAGARWGDGLVEYLGWLYPAGGEWLAERTRTVVRAAELLGIAAASVPSTAGAALLVSGADAAADAIAGLLPSDVRQVYIQHDLSIIAPGPLAADLDRRLRTVAEVETVGLASSYRVTTASVTRALTMGTSIGDVRGLLAEISLTGIPQPLDYLLTETAARFGSLRVGALEGQPDTLEANAHSYVRAEDPALVGQLAIDQALTPIGLRRTGEHRAVSRFDAETVYWALIDARYPAVLEDAEGRVRAVRRAAPHPTASESASDPVMRLVRRIREASCEQPEKSDVAWNARQLELAIRGRLRVRVVVRMPDGDEVGYLLEPTGLAGGRLRARDRGADIERTLPLSHIVAVEPA